MNPKTKLQIRVDQLSHLIPDLTEKQKDYALTHCFSYWAYRTKHDLTCFECGNRWKVKDTSLLIVTLGVTCPECGKELKIYQGKDRKDKIGEYFCIITTCEEFQVIRQFWVERNCKVGQKADYFIKEAIQCWIGPDGKLTTRTLTVVMSSMYIDLWSKTSNLETRAYYHTRCNVDPKCIYPTRKYLDVLKRNGFKGNFHGLTPLKLFMAILTNPRVETLLKTGQYSMLKYCMDKGIEKYWPSIKICIRNNYIITSASMWCDHIEMLQELGKDIRNAKYVCPVDLKTEHQRLIAKLDRIDKLREDQELIEKISAAEQIYTEQKSKFFGIQFVDGDLKVAVLESVKEFHEEGWALKHCVFRSKYYEQKDSLILSARKNDERLETIEVSLNKMDVIQSRGLQNKNTKYHDRIVNLVRSNLRTIMERVSALKHM